MTSKYVVETFWSPLTNICVILMVCFTLCVIATVSIVSVLCVWAWKEMLVDECRFCQKEKVDIVPFSQGDELVSRNRNGGT
jgi:hypothetical protein